MVKSRIFVGRAHAALWRDASLVTPRRLLHCAATPSSVTPRHDAFFGYAATGRLLWLRRDRTHGAPSAPADQRRAPAAAAALGDARPPVRAGFAGDVGPAPAPGPSRSGSAALPATRTAGERNAARRLGFQARWQAASGMFAVTLAVTAVLE